MQEYQRLGRFQKRWGETRDVLAGSSAGIENLNQPVNIQQFTRSESIYHDTLTMTQEVKDYDVHSAIGPRSFLALVGEVLKACVGAKQCTANHLLYLRSLGWRSQ